MLLLLGVAARAQTPASAPKPEPDVLIFNDGEKLIGHLVSAHDGKVTFKSDMAGDITVEWTKVKELRSSQKFAVVTKEVHLGRRPDTSQIPHGTVSVANQEIEVHVAAAEPKAVPLTTVGHLIEDSSFEKAVENPSFLRDWKGAVTGGVTAVQATQKSDTFTGGFNFVRAIPGQDWLAPRNRTLVDFNVVYGKVTQPGTPSLKTEIYHANLERDEYFSSRAFVFGQISYDHNFSQGLDLQQDYGGGFGWVVLRTDNQELDLKGGVTYIQQGFNAPNHDQSLVGSTFGENYNRKFRHGILLAEQFTVTPAWNNTNAYSADGQRECDYTALQAPELRRGHRG